jgi:N-acetylglucosaminyldiphosphoundecaprenol N-acetyl-beta-D-mannosaminyltransferase
MVEILGVPFATLSFEETVEKLIAAMEKGDKPHHIVTAGPELIMMALNDERLMNVLRSVDLVTPDGIGAVWASKFYGHPLPGRVTGMELSTAMIEAASRRGWRVYLLGAKPEANRLALEKLRAQYPDLNIAGRDGYFGEEKFAQVIAEVKAFAPHLLLVGLGQPRQEFFIHDHKEQLGVPVMVGCGGVIDVFAGTVKRAPLVWQKLNLEWLYRLLSQPSRWRRQLALPRFVLKVLGDPGRKR